MWELFINGIILLIGACLFVMARHLGVDCYNYFKNKKIKNGDKKNSNKKAA